MSALLTLIASLISFYGISEIYNGRKEEQKAKATKGIIFCGIGVLGIGLLNPIFENMLLSIISTLAFSGLSLGLIAHTFLKTHAEETIIHADVETDFEEEQVKSQKSLTYDMQANSTMPIPMEFKQREIVEVKRR